MIDSPLEKLLITSLRSPSLTCGWQPTEACSPGSNLTFASIYILPPESLGSPVLESCTCRVKPERSGSASPSLITVMYYMVPPLSVSSTRSRSTSTSLELPPTSEAKIEEHLGAPGPGRPARRTPEKGSR